MPRGGRSRRATRSGSFAEALRAGKIGALKGLGGYHLACDARNAAAVAELRRRKHRDEKPFAVMVADEAAAAALCEVGPAERALLSSPRRPIVLLRERSPGIVAREVAPGNPWLGVMLPYTPLHHLLLRAVGGIPLVMTSGNRSDEPIAYEDDAVEKLAGIADLFLVHDRAIHVRCDDSVSRVVDGVELPVRRSRGYAPQPMTSAVECPRPILAVGGQLKVTFALGSGRQAFLGHHLGDLDHYEAYKAFRKDVELYQQLFGITPECLAHDLHPDYATTRYAHEVAERAGTRLLGVQHHHAHMASCMAEHGLTGPVIGVTFDGTGYGTDGAVWGGEFLVGDYRRIPPRSPLALRRHAGGREGDPRALADGGCPRNRCRCEDSRNSGTAFASRIRDGRANAGAGREYSVHFQRGAAVRCRRRDRGRARSRHFRRAGCHGARVARRERPHGRGLSHSSSGPCSRTIRRNRPSSWTRGP